MMRPCSGGGGRGGGGSAVVVVRKRKRKNNQFSMMVGIPTRGGDGLFLKF